MSYTRSNTTQSVVSSSIYMFAGSIHFFYQLVSAHLVGDVCLRYACHRNLNMNKFVNTASANLQTLPGLLFLSTRRACPELLPAHAYRLVCRHHALTSWSTRRIASLSSNQTGLESVYARHVEFEFLKNIGLHIGHLLRNTAGRWTINEPVLESSSMAIAANHIRSIYQLVSTPRTCFCRVLSNNQITSLDGANLVAVTSLTNLEVTNNKLAAITSSSLPASLLKLYVPLPFH